MRRYYLLLMLMWVLPWKSYGQAPKAEGHWAFGVMAGSQLAGKIYETTKMGRASGFVGGLDIAYVFEKGKSGPSVHFQPNFSTFKKKEIDGLSSTMYYTETKWKWEALTLPVLVRYTFTKGRLRPFAEVGVSWRYRTGFSVRTHRERCGFAGCEVSDKSSDIQANTKQDKIGILAGVGTELDVWNLTIPVTVRIAESVRRYRGTDDQGPNTTHLNLKTKVVQISAGITF